MRSILVTGGAGYIGSAMVKLLHEAGHHPVILDNLSTGHREAVLHGDFVEGDIGDQSLVTDIIRQYKIATVMHFSAFSLVGESVQDPARYYHNNVAKTLALLNSMRATGANQFVFSSTAAVYGEPAHVPINEQEALTPSNPYGRSKLMVESLLQDFSAAYGLRSVALRYFNAAGATPEAAIGERHDPETHLIPNALQVVSGRKDKFTLHGKDYPTPDGTCIRDYIHIVDLCQAHLQAVEYLQQGGESEVFNLGNGDGYSVRQILDMIESVTERRLTIEKGSRRPGDPAKLVADASKANTLLHWQPEYNLHAIIQHAWSWEQHLVSMHGAKANDDG